MEFLFPKECRRILMNEAHVRLASSLWYACEYIRFMALTGTILGIFSNSLLYHYWGDLRPSFVIIPLAIVFASIIIQSSIETSFHYQRCREVFYVLQFALLANNREKDILCGLSLSDKNGAGSRHQIAANPSHSDQNFALLDAYDDPPSP